MVTPVLHVLPLRSPYLSMIALLVLCDFRDFVHKALLQRAEANFSSPAAR